MTTMTINPEFIIKHNDLFELSDIDMDVIKNETEKMSNLLVKRHGATDLTVIYNENTLSATITYNKD